MADFDQALSALLADPEAMGQIMDLAGRLNLNPSGDEPPEGDSAPVSPSLTEPVQASELGRLLSVFQTQKGPDRQAEALLRALRPYLREERRRKLDRALRFAGLSQGVQQALRLWKEGELHL